MTYKYEKQIGSVNKGTYYSEPHATDARIKQLTVEQCQQEMINFSKTFYWSQAIKLFKKCTK